MTLPLERCDRSLLGNTPLNERMVASQTHSCFCPAAADGRSPGPSGRVQLGRATLTKNSRCARHRAVNHAASGAIVTNPSTRRLVSRRRKRQSEAGFSAPCLHPAPPAPLLRTEPLIGRVNETWAYVLFVADELSSARSSASTNSILCEVEHGAYFLSSM